VHVDAGEHALEQARGQRQLLLLRRKVVEHHQGCRFEGVGRHAGPRLAGCHVRGQAVGLDAQRERGALTADKRRQQVDIMSVETLAFKCPEQAHCRELLSL
jgi:hypothetical protein